MTGSNIMLSDDERGLVVQMVNYILCGAKTDRHVNGAALVKKIDAMRRLRARLSP